MTRLVWLLLALVLAFSVWLWWVDPAGADGGGKVYNVSSTAYDDWGLMASGNYVYDGAVACNFLPLGTRTLVLSGSYAGRVLVVEDRIGWGSEYDIWMATGALQYGRQQIMIQLLPELTSNPLQLDQYRAWTIGRAAWLRMLYGAREQ